MIKRTLTQQMLNRMNDSKALIVIGPRQTGKTTLIKLLTEELNQPALWWNGDDSDIRALLANPTTTQLKQLIGTHTLLIIDEAQRIENIGICIKLIVDNLPGIKVIATGSSAFELANSINEPLTGRKWEYQLLPLSFEEMSNHTSLLEERRLLEHRLVYGYYPDVINHPGDEQELLKQLSDSYLYKDILIWQQVQKPAQLERLVQALAFQIGNEVTYHELGQICSLDNQTVERYIDLLEKAFVVYRLGSLSRNLRNELKKSRKIYFYDNGLRNAIINNFAPVNMRNDIGALWENFLIGERLKQLHYHRHTTNRFFWRTHAQQEIDYIEERNGRFLAVEFKWSPNQKARIPKPFINAYPNSDTLIVTPDNFEEFLAVDITS